MGTKVALGADLLPLETSTIAGQRSAYTEGFRHRVETDMGWRTIRGVKLC